jgi:hypothetical protein
MEKRVLQDIEATPPGVLGSRGFEHPKIGDVICIPIFLFSGTLAKFEKIFIQKET